MLFNSIEFLIFFPLVVALFFSLPARLRPPLILAASYLFYMAWNPAYILLILVSTAVDYIAGRRIGAADALRTKRRWLGLSLVVNLGLLFTFKYFNFVGEVFREFAGLASLEIAIPHLDVLLPVGISFYTFQTLSYTIEVYRGRQEPVRDPLHFALYVAYFPQLVAGPIERPQNLLPQLMRKYDFDYDRVVSGLRLILWGMFKKVVIADRLAVVVDTIYGQPERYPGPFLAVATLFFCFQIYCDFSGYSDIAIGAARVMGIRLMKNFDRPYFSASIAEYWRRWHISLSTWFRDYVYLPLGGSRASRTRWLLAVFAVFGLSGLWHGANWTFIVWSMLHASYYFGEVGLRKIGLPKPPRPIAVALTFVLLNLGWVLFRAATLSDAAFILSHLGTGWVDLAPYGGFARLIGSLDISANAFYLDALLIAFLLVAEGIQRDRDVDVVIAALPTALRWAVYVVLGWAMMNLGVTHEIPFVYFQF